MTRVDRVTRGLALPIAVTCGAFVVGYLQKVPCYRTGWRSEPRVRFSEFCYSDMSILFRERGLIAGVFPYSEQAWRHPLEYPVLTGLAMDWTARLTRLVAPGASSLTMSRLYFNLNVGLLLGCALAMVWATGAALRRSEPAGAPAATLLVAAAPSLALAGTINWDLIAVTCAAGTVLAWYSGRPGLTGALLGLGTAAKLFPALLLGPLLLVCLRQRRLPEFFRATATGVVVWAAVNAPVALGYPEGWLEFWRFNAERRADYGSVWHALVIAGADVDPERLNVVAGLILAGLLTGVAALALFAPRPPSLAQLALLTIAAFLITNKVYSPQYVLWLLPLVVLARTATPVRRAAVLWGGWQLAEMVYWLAIWRHFTDLPDDQAWQYPAAIAVRIAATVWLSAVVVRDCLRRPAEPAPGTTLGTLVLAGRG